MKKYYKFLLVFVVAFAISCKANTEIDLLVPPPDDITEQNVNQTQLIERGLAQLQLSDAEKVALRFMLKDTKKPFTVSAATRADQMTAVRDSLGNPLMYVVNFEQGGFCIVSATKKSYPILAHGESGFFDLEKVGESGVCLWLDEMAYGIASRDTLSEEERIFVNSAWAEYEKGFDVAETRAYGDMNDPRYRAFSDRMGYHMSNGDAIPLANASASGVIPSYVVSGFQNLASNMGCPPEYAIIVRVPKDHTQTIGPLVKTNWHQKYPYNDGCFTLGGEKAVAGCVAIAVAQIMNFHQHPHDFYDWRGIAAGNTTHIANFVADVGKSIGIKYGVTNSSATDGQALNALVGKFKYNAKLVSTEPLSEIAFHRPYYAAGSSDKSGYAGHTWVINGTETYIANTVFKLDCQVYRNGQYVYESNSGYDYDYSSRDPMHKKTHINWGWNAATNGWYTAGNHSQVTGSLDYRYHRAYITINPIDRKPLPGDGPIILPPTGGGTITPPPSGGGIVIPPIDGGTVIPPIGGGDITTQRP